MRIRRIPALLLAAAAVTGPVALAGAGPAAAHGGAAAPATAAPYCGIRWGSLPKADLGPIGGEITGVRAGRHACFDRLVVDVFGDAPGWRVRYVDEVRRGGDGPAIPLRGGARLEVLAVGSGMRTDAPFVGTGEVVDTRGFRTLREVRSAGAFEGHVVLGVGVRARLPFRAFVLDGPGDGSRLVVDVTHHW